VWNHRNPVVLRHLFRSKEAPRFSQYFPSWHLKSKISKTLIKKYLCFQEQQLQTHPFPNFTVICSKNRMWECQMSKLLVWQVAGKVYLNRNYRTEKGLVFRQTSSGQPLAKPQSHVPGFSNRKSDFFLTVENKYRETAQFYFKNFCLSIVSIYRRTSQRIVSEVIIS
jgi:hypothetical protein